MVSYFYISIPISSHSPSLSPTPEYEADDIIASICQQTAQQLAAQGLVPARVRTWGPLEGVDEEMLLEDGEGVSAFELRDGAVSLTPISSDGAAAGEDVAERQSVSDAEAGATQLSRSQPLHRVID